MNYYNAEAYIGGSILSAIIISFVFRRYFDVFVEKGFIGIICLVICYSLPLILIILSIRLIAERNRVKRFGKAYDGKIICMYKPPFLFSDGKTYCRYTVAYAKGERACVTYFKDRNYDRRLKNLGCKVYVLDEKVYVCGFNHKKIFEKGIRIPKE